MRHRALRALVGKCVDDFEHNHRFQARFHIVMMLFWIGALFAGVAVLVWWPQAWLKTGVFLVYVISIYANWDTDADAMTAAQGAQHAQDVLDRLVSQVTSGGTEPHGVVLEQPECHVAAGAEGASEAPPA